MNARTAEVGDPVDPLGTLLPLPPMGAVSSGAQWRLRESNDREALAIAQKIGVDLLLARVLVARGVSLENAAEYLSPSLRHSLPDPNTLKDMDKAAQRLADAVQNGEEVGVFGDYDVDGTTSAAILKIYFDALGSPLHVYLPDRITEGYGPNIDAFRSLKNDGARLVVTVDCGATADAVINEAADDGIEIIVIDHHQMSDCPPAGAYAVVNPNRTDDISGLTDLSAAGLSFLAAIALNRALRERGYFEDRKEPNLLELLDLTALGLVCDVMPMTGLTRILVAQGLKIFGGDGNPGLKSLARHAGAKGPPSGYHFGFLLGPRINAAGRIGHAQLAFDLLTTDDPQKRETLAERLHTMNAERQAIEKHVQEEALRDIEMHQRQGDSVIITAGDGWHPGVIGIVAGRLKDVFQKPVLVIGLEEGEGKGSGRSISGVDLGSAITAAREAGILNAGGGHAMAAGLSIDRSNIDKFRKALNAQLGSAVEAALENRRLDLDAVIAPSAVSKAFADLIATAGPFGPGNPEPQFVLANMRVRYPKVVGGDHLSVMLESETGEEVRAIAFRAEGKSLGEFLRAGRRIHLAGRVKADDWRGGNAGQFQITDAAYAE